MKWFLYISELMLATLFRETIKNIFILDPVQEQPTNRNFTGCHMPH